MDKEMNDFSGQANFAILLETIKKQQIAIDNLTQLLAATKQQKDQLEKEDEKVNDIALFAMQTPNPLFRIHTNGNILLMNPAAEELATFYYQKHFYKTEEFWKLISAEGNYTDSQWSFEAVSNDKTYCFFCRYLPLQGYYNVYGRDISQQKKNEEELERLSLVASANQSGVVFNNTKGEIFWVNEGFCKMTGFSYDEIIGKSPLDFCRGPLTDEAILQHIESSMGHAETFNDELIHYRKDGSWFWASVKGQSFKNAEREELQYFAVVNDITKEKKKEEELRLLSQIAESNINAVIMTDKEGRITWINESFTRLTSYTHAEVVGKKPGDLLQGTANNDQTKVYLDKQVIDGQAFSAEIYNYSKTGKPFWLRIQGQPFYDSNGELSGFFALEENITKEKEAQERVKESESQLRATLEKIGDNVWEYDFRTGSTKFSKSNNQLWGFPAENVVDDGQLWWDRVFIDDQYLFKENYKKYQNGAVSHNLEYRIVHQDGSIRWVMDRGALIEADEDGTPLRIVGTHTDITQIKRTEAELEQRVKQFKSLSENVPGVIYEYEFKNDGTEEIRYVSPAMKTIFGIRPTTFQEYLSYIHPDDRERIIRKNTNSKKTDEPFYDESRLIIPNVGMRWHSVQSAFSYISQSGARVFTGFMTDITERKNAEQTLQANEEKYRRILTNMKLGMMEVDNNSCITYANNSFCEMSGYSLNELIGNSAYLLFLPDNPALEEEKKKNREEGKSDAYELETKDKSGNKKWWLISGAPSYDDKGVLVGSIGIHLDITEQKKQERELIEARIQAEQLVHTKETFLANMSHEIRTPMNAIMGMSSQLAKTNLLPQQRFYLETILSASETLLIIINDILDLSKIEAGKLVFESIGFELNTLLNNAITVVTHKAEEKGLALNSYFDNNISPVLIGDPHRLSQVLLNLLTNAVKFTENGSVKLQGTLITDRPDSQVIRVEVKDTGIGMDESFIKILFEKFSQEYDSTSRQHGGTGLGMSICKELIDLMGGKIFVDSKKDEGTTMAFVIELKKGTNADLPEKYINQFSSSFLSGKKILVTDDNDLNRLVASIILQNYDGIVSEAKNGEMAVEMITKEKFDVILMDIQMPIMNGFEATRTLRKNGYSIPIIALTAAAIRGEREKCIDAGMNDYITKPFKEEVFLKTIDTWLKTEPALSEREKLSATTKPDKLYDLATLKEISRGNGSFVKKMVGIFCDQTPNMVKEMTDAYYANDLVTMGNIAHKMKASLDNLGIISLNKIIRDIELAGREEIKNPDLPRLLEEANSILAKVVYTMKIEYPTVSSNPR